MSLIMSAWGNDLRTLKGFIAGGADVNAVDLDEESGCTALWWAANRGYVECAAALIDAKADVHKANNNGYTPLFCASINGHVECVRVLIKHNANVNALNTDGSSSLHSASSNGHLACTQILIAAGAERDRHTKYGYTPLTFAIAHNYSHVAEFLLHSGARMENVCKAISVPHWMTCVIRTRRSVMSSTLVLKGLLKRRFGISKDATHLIALYFWSERLK
jgi:ankyrin repeat protein